MNREHVIRDINERFLQSGHSLNERERRRWAAAEATRLGRGGIVLVSKALRMSPNTIKKGMQEMAAGDDLSSDTDIRIRKPGGGRKPKKSSTDRFSETGSNRRSASDESDAEASD